MKNSLASMLGIVAVLAASWALAGEECAQAAEMAAACPPQAAQITVETEYVTTSLRDFVNESARIAPGREHDALVRAALLSDGAEDDQGAQITTTDGVMGGVCGAIQVGKQTLNSFTRVKPRINKNGLITVEMTNHRETLSPVTRPGAVLPSVQIMEISGTKTFIDGQTLVINSMSDDDGAGTKTSPLLVVFAKVEVAARPLSAPAAVPSVGHT